MTRAQRLKRVLAIDIETCPACGGAVRIIACIEDAEVIDKILTHLDAKTAEPGEPAVSGATPSRLVRLICKRRNRPRRLRNQRTRQGRARPVGVKESENCSEMRVFLN